MATTLLTLMLSWNRPNMLEKTIHSYLKTVSVPFRLIVLDNASNQETISLLKNLSKHYHFEVVFLKENIGGRAFNPILDREKDYRFVHFSENDLEYYPDWDKQLVKKLNTFPRVGQISPYSPFPRFDIGQIMIRHKNASPLTRNGQTVYLANNVGTTSIVRKELIDRGLRWLSPKSPNGFSLPSDVKFSKDVKKLGWQVAWNDEHLATNWGHNITEFQDNLDYYIKNYKAKGVFPLLQQRLKEQGYDLIEESNGRYRIETLQKPLDN